MWSSVHLPCLQAGESDADYCNLITCRIIAAVYQLPDGLYGVALGWLCGLGMQPRLLWVNLGGLWGIGMVLGILLTFKAPVGIIGLWYGLLSGITATGACVSLCFPPPVNMLSYALPEAPLPTPYSRQRRCSLGRICS